MKRASDFFALASNVLSKLSPDLAEANKASSFGIRRRDIELDSCYLALETRVYTAAILSSATFAQTIFYKTVVNPWIQYRELTFHTSYRHIHFQQGCR